MFTSLVPRIAGDDEPPDNSRHRLRRRRLGCSPGRGLRTGHGLRDDGGTAAGPGAVLH